MRRFGKAQLVSLAATGVDFGVTVGVRAALQGEAVVAAALGTVCGGVIHFCLCRHWVFGTGGERTGRQAIRYGLTWTGNLVLSAAGVYLLTHLAALHYLAAKGLVSAVLAFGFNYFVQTHFVFRRF